MLFRNASSPASSRRSSGNASIFSGRSSGGRRNIVRQSPGASSQSSGVRVALKAGLTDAELRDVADRIDKGASQKYGSLQKALKSVWTDTRSGISRTGVRNFCNEYGLTKRDSDRLFDKLDESREGRVNMEDFKDWVLSTAPKKTEATIEKDMLQPSATPPGSAIPTRNTVFADVESERDVEVTTINPSFVNVPKSLKQLRTKDLDKLFNDLSDQITPNLGNSSHTFRDMDDRGMRRVNKENITKALRANGYDDSVASQLFDYVTKDGNGDIDFREFKRLFSHAMLDWRKTRGQRPREALGEGSKENIRLAERVADNNVQAAPPKCYSQSELEDILKDVCLNIGLKHESVRKAYTEMVLKGKNKFDRQCLRANLEVHGYDANASEQLFTYLDKNKNGFFNYGEFRDAFGPYLMPNWVEAKETKPKKDKEDIFDAVPHAIPHKLCQKELKHIFEDVAASIAWHNDCSVKKAWESLNRSRQGKVGPDQLTEYMTALNYDSSTAEQLFKYLDKDNSGEMSYEQFRQWFGPYVMPDWVEDKKTKRFDRGLPTVAREPKDREVRRVVKEIGEAMGQKYKSSYDAFERLDFNGNGAISKEEVREFFSHWNYDTNLADRFFSEMDMNADGDIDYAEFCSHFTRYIVTGYDGKGFGTTNGEFASIRSRQYPVKVNDPELSKAIQGVGEGCKARFGDIRRAWHMVYNDKDGTASRDDICKFLSLWGYSKKVGDKLFDHLASEGSDRIDYRSFHNQFAPYVYGWPELGQERLNRSSSVEASGAGLEDGCASVLSARSSRSQRQNSDKLAISARSSVAQSLNVPKLKQREVAQIFEDFAVAFSRHNPPSVNKAWGALNPARVGAITKEKLQYIMTTYGYDEATSSQVFDYIDKDGSGQIGYQEFQSLLGPYIMPDWIDQKQRSKKDRGWPVAAPAFKDKELKKVVHELGEAFGKKHRTAFAAFRQMDANSSGTLTRNEVRDFFNKFNFSQSLADRFFDSLDQNIDGEIDYREFQSHFSPYILKGYDGKAWGQREVPEISGSERLLAPKVIHDKELARAVESVGLAASKRYRSIRDAWRAVDMDKDGKICREDVKEWFSHYGYGEDMANKFFDYVNHDGDTIDYREFNKHFGPHIFGWRQLGLETLHNYRSRSEPSLGVSPRSQFSQDCAASTASDASRTTRYSSDVSRTTRYSDKDLNRISSHIGEKMREKHGNNVRRAFRNVAHDHKLKGFVTRADMKRLCNNYGYADVADELFDKFDTEQTDGVRLSDIQKHFADKILNPQDYDGQTSYRSAYG